MARKLIDQDEVARLLGITPEQVGSLRNRKKLFPYRDGDQWKYKQEDIDRLKAEMEDEKSSQSEEEPTWTGEGDLEDVELELNDDLDSILLSEIELGKSSTEGASTIIGKMGGDADVDLPMAADPKKTKTPPPGDSAVPLAGGPGGPATKGDSTLTLGGDVPAAGGSSGFSLAGDSGIKLAGDAKSPGGSGFTLPGDTGIGITTESKGDSGITLAGDSNLTLGSDVKLVPGSEAGKKSPGGSSDKLFGSDALKLDDDELSLMDMSSTAAPAKPSGSGPKKSSGSSIKLGDEELEVVLGGSDVTQSPTDSGIQLISASDSGLSLDQPLELGSSARRLLDMPEEAPAAKKKGGKAKADSDADVEIKADDDFLLTAMDDTGSEESSDSGSQVIALDADDELSSGMFAPVAGAADLLEEEPTSVTPLSGAPLMAAAPTLSGSTAMMGAAYSEPVEAPFSGPNVAILSICAVFLLFCGMITFDLMRNMWSWEGPYSVNSSIIESVGKTVGWMDK